MTAARRSLLSVGLLRSLFMDHGVPARSRAGCRAFSKSGPLCIPVTDRRPCELPRSPFVARQRSAEGIPDYSQITDNTQRRCAVHTKSGKEINLNGLVGSVPSS